MNSFAVCETCKHWDPYASGISGHCHFHAPMPFVVSDETTSSDDWEKWVAWPITSFDDFCSNWKQTKKGGK